MRYGFDQFAKGDAFCYYNVHYHNISQAAYNFARKRGWKFVVNTAPKGVYITRVS